MFEGFVKTVFIGAGGASDLGANMATEVMPMLTKGALILFGGIVVKDTKDFFADYDHALSKGKAE